MNLISFKSNYDGRMSNIEVQKYQDSFVLNGLNGCIKFLYRNGTN